MPRTIHASARKSIPRIARAYEKLWGDHSARDVDVHRTIKVYQYRNIYRHVASRGGVSEVR